MGFWIFMTLMTLLTPVTMLLLGRRFFLRPPERINGAFGYRTARSMKNKDTWDFAHRCCGRAWFRWGLAMALLSLLVMALLINRGLEEVGAAGLALVLAQLFPLIGTIFTTERALKRTFDDFGLRREGR